MKQYLVLFFAILGITLYAQSVKLDSSNLPICIIDTRGKTIGNEPKVLAHMKIIYNGPGKMNKVKDQIFNYNNFIAIETRGNSSQAYPQKQYGLELRDSLTGSDLNAALIGMPEEEDWVLYAPYNDISLLRNVLTYHLWNEMGHWGPRTRFCELILNNEYVGVYILMESIKRDKNRVDVAKLTEVDTTGRDLTGGYIMKIDKKNNASDLGFVSKVKSTSNQDITWLYHYPDSNDIKAVQQDYIHKFIDSVELLIASPGFADPKNGYKKYISVNSFIDYFLINEFSRNIDAYKASSYFYKEKLEADGSKGMLKAGPVWDYNFAFGNASFCSGSLTTGWMYDGCVPATLPTPIMWRRLLGDSNYVNAVKCRYLELRKTLLDTSYLFAYLNRYAFDTLDAAQKRHFSKWKILGTNPGGFNAYIALSYTDEMTRFKSWIRNRLNWMDANLPGRCIPPPVVAKIEIPLDPECFSGPKPVMQSTQPFKGTPFNYPGNEQIKVIPKDILRWVLVELRDPSDSTKIVDRRAALLRSDSVLLDTNFSVGVFFPKATPNQSYFILVRYDAYGILMSKDRVLLPNDNDYNLNRSHRLNAISGGSPLIYNSKWLGADSFAICKGQPLVLSDSNLVKLGYGFSGQVISCMGAPLNILNDHQIALQFDTSGGYSIELHLSCLGHSLIRTRFFVEVRPEPKCAIYGPYAFCAGDTIQLRTDTFTSYLWSTGEQSQSVRINKAGSYSVQIKDVHGCLGLASKDIVMYPEIKGNIVALPGSMPNRCKFYFVPEDSMARYYYLWANGVQTDTFETGDQSISLIVTDSNACRKKFTVLCVPVSNEELQHTGIQVFPNPNMGSFRIISDRAFQYIRFYASSGQLLYSRSFEGTCLKEYHGYFQDMTPGVYFVQATCEGKLYGFRVMVLGSE